MIEETWCTLFARLPGKIRFAQTSARFLVTHFRGRAYGRRLALDDEGRPTGSYRCDCKRRVNSPDIRSGHSYIRYTFEFDSSTGTDID